MILYDYGHSLPLNRMWLCRFEFTVLPSLKCLGRVLFRLPLTNTESESFTSLLRRGLFRAALTVKAS